MLPPVHLQDTEEVIPPEEPSGLVIHKGLPTGIEDFTQEKKSRGGRIGGHHHMIRTIRQYLDPAHTTGTSQRAW